MLILKNKKMWVLMKQQFFKNLFRKFAIKLETDIVIPEIDNI